mmetsp:Transcript_6930/g.7918  ORF Transcript_6930/g.7918 Transcript_6930/m.7918 type:complete len:402 (-) Transcript_6930:642-1847(-)|eukprot:CAMPEP_0197858008 /NCGR_PEP_ID=MMETSP1438-20131217/31500_1 /TAXON_ID=1461541 /ORGANISM="Pterosperma sp., Strain CCMP1384" /LENGTH=401 /DNA_ID=CAMNT_0043474029 /DNA_START=282 /DNA_END=1487 /DNA_ORIENTATION=+
MSPNILQEQTFKSSNLPGEDVKEHMITNGGNMMHDRTSNDYTHLIQPLAPLPDANQWLAVTNDLLDCFVNEYGGQGWGANELLPDPVQAGNGNNHAGMRDLSESSDGSNSSQVPQEKQSHEKSELVQSASNKKGGQTPAQLQAQRRYRERQRQKVGVLEEEVTQLRARVVDLENEIIDLKANGCSVLGSSDNNTMVDLTTFSKKELYDIYWRNVDHLRSLLDAGEAADIVTNQVMRMAQVCQAKSRMEGGPEAGATVPNGRQECECLIPSDTDTLEVYKRLINDINFTPTQLNKMLAWRCEYLDSLDEIFRKRQMIMAELFQAVPMHANGSQSTGTSNGLIEKLKTNLQDQQMVGCEMTKRFVFGSYVSIQQVARCIVSLAPVAFNPLTLSNLVLKSELSA